MFHSKPYPKYDYFELQICFSEFTLRIWLIFLAENISYLNFKSHLFFLLYVRYVFSVWLRDKSNPWQPCFLHRCWGTYANMLVYVVFLFIAWGSFSRVFDCFDSWLLWIFYLYHFSFIILYDSEYIKLLDGSQFMSIFG